MAQVIRRIKVVGNPSRRAFGSAPRKKYKRANAGRRAHRNPGQILGFTLAGNPGRKQAHMAQSTKRKKTNPKRRRGYAMSHYKNPHRRRTKHQSNPAGKMHRRRYKRNPTFGGTSELTGLVTNAVFVIVGALGSKLGAQAVLGTNNVGVIGYAGNAAVGVALWFITEKLMKNKAASAGIISGTLVQILLRVINDYTPFGSYVAQLGMGDYQMQSFVTPQVLVDPWNSARIRVPAGFGPGRTGIVPAGTPMPSGARGRSAAAPAAAAPAAAAPAAGVSGLYNAGGGFSPGLYRA